jgi:hypothetical protein
LHSVVDYPLRTPTLSVLFAMACGFLIPPRKVEHSAQMSRGIENLARENSGWPRSRLQG